MSFEINIDNLMNHIPGGIAVYQFSDPMKILYFNDGLCALSGHTREEYLEFIEGDALRIVYDEDRPSLMLEINTALQEKRNVNFTYRIKHKNGEAVWVQLNAAKVSEEAEGLIYYAIFVDVSDEREIQKRLIKLAEHDNLTGVLNRITLERKIEKYLLNHEGASAAFVILDIDNFKRVNDFFGHIKGDETLCMIGDLLNDIFGPRSYVARIGGDEFAVFLCNVGSREEVEEIVGRFCKASTIVYDYQSSEIRISCSLGIAMSPKDGINYTSLYANADKALLYAKNNGKGQYQFWADHMAPPSAMLLQNMEWLLDEGITAVYICNSATYELLYMNRLGRQIAGARGNSYLGKMCYKELMHRDEPCPFCKMHSMGTEAFCEREFLLPGTEIKLIMKGKLIDWNGIRVHVEFIIKLQ